MPREPELVYADDCELCVKNPRGSRRAFEECDPHGAVIRASCANSQQLWVIRVEFRLEVDGVTGTPNNCLDIAFEGR